MKNRIQTGSTDWNNTQRLGEGELTFDEEAKALRVHGQGLLGGLSLPGTLAIPQAPGPGPKYFVAGDDDLGYYGTLADSEFFTRDALIAAVGYSEGNVVSEASSFVWFKFAYQGKVLYIPQYPLVQGAKWSTLYQAGLVYGIDGAGPDPFPSDSPVNQKITVSLGDDVFNVRLLTGSSANPAPDSSGGGEWNDLLYRVSETDPNGDYWDDYRVDRLLSGAGSVSWCQESYGSGNRVARGYSASNSLSYWGPIYPDFSNNNNYGWRPCLELVQ